MPHDLPPTYDPRSPLALGSTARDPVFYCELSITPPGPCGERHSYIGHFLKHEIYKAMERVPSDRSLFVCSHIYLFPYSNCVGWRMNSALSAEAERRLYAQTECPMFNLSLSYLILHARNSIKIERGTFDLYLFHHLTESLLSYRLQEVLSPTDRRGSIVHHIGVASGDRGEDSCTIGPSVKGVEAQLGPHCTDGIQGVNGASHCR